MLPDPQVVAEQVLQIVGQKAPPTDVRKILSKWPSLSVVETELDGDGFFVDLGDAGGEIFIKKNRVEIRKRFTLAHELGHVVLRSHLWKSKDKAEIERWCNRFAAELLLPRGFVSRYLKADGINGLIERIQGGPETFQVSEQTFLLRLPAIFPLSILKARLSRTRLIITQEFRSRELDEYLGTNQLTIIDAEIERFVRDLAENEVLTQRQYKKADRTWLAKAAPKNRGEQFLLVVMKR